MRASLVSHSNRTSAVYITAGPAGTPPASFCMYRPGSGWRFSLTPRGDTRQPL